MDTNRPSPRQLQGPRPAPLKVRKESYKINKKPPAVPQNPNQALPPNPSSSSQQQLPPRPPVIIYTVSPKIIHTNPSGFMTLVQRLTGPDYSLHPPAAAALSPAARFAAIENADRFSPRNNNNNSSNTIIDVDDGDEDLLYMGSGGGGTTTAAAAAVCSNQPGILSPMPSSLQPIPPSFFSPISSYDPGSFAFLHDLSPAPNAGFLFSPHYLLATPTVPSPGALWDLFNQF